MAGTKKLSNHFTEHMHFVISYEMRKALSAYTRENGVSQGYIVRQLLAEFLGLDETHVLGPTGLEASKFIESQKDNPRRTVIKRIFPDQPHPLEAAWGKPVLKPKDDDE